MTLWRRGRSAFISSLVSGLVVMSVIGGAVVHEDEVWPGVDRAGAAGTRKVLRRWVSLMVGNPGGAGIRNPGDLKGPITVGGQLPLLGSTIM
jgi:hypothetical protein